VEDYGDVFWVFFQKKKAKKSKKKRGNRCWTKRRKSVTTCTEKINDKTGLGKKYAGQQKRQQL
jgi:hypothetical protein